ncbi:MAG: hypothetical protein M3O15_16475, partial [Acidobacteriota bacterium]|nr:hypothetical protein [Acidobacteriota bacterium]
MATLPLLLLLLLQPVLAQDQWRLVYQDGEVAAPLGMPRLSAAERSRLQLAWVWSEPRAPRRLAPAAVGREFRLPP